MAYYLCGQANRSWEHLKTQTLPDQEEDQGKDALLWLCTVADWQSSNQTFYTLEQGSQPSAWGTDLVHGTMSCSPWGFLMGPENWWWENSSTAPLLPNLWTHGEPQALCTGSGPWSQHAGPSSVRAQGPISVWAAERRWYRPPRIQSWCTEQRSGDARPQGPIWPTNGVAPIGPKGWAPLY